MMIKILALSLSLFSLAACSNKPAETNEAKETNETKEISPASERAKEVLTQSGVLMPDESARSSTLDTTAVNDANTAAVNLEGSRAPFEFFHDDVAPLLPTTKASGLNLIPAVQCQAVDTDADPSNDCPVSAVDEETDPLPVPDPTPAPEEKCPKVCATACASATATATAAAFAHASVQACAFAEAWACVFSNVPPFGKVCSWAKSQACASAFAVAFGYGFATSTDQECKTVCSDGTTTVTKGPVADEALKPATAQ
jgi:hypothetical protein